MKVQSGKEAWSHHFRPGRSLGTSTDKGKKTGGFEDKRRNGKDPASAPQGALAGEATIHRRTRPHGTDRRTGFGDRAAGRENRAAADKGLGTRQWREGKERRRGRRGKGTGRRGRKRDTSRAALPRVARLEGGTEKVETTGEVRDESREHESAAGEGGPGERQRDARRGKK